MTSMGRLLVVISMGAPHERHVTVIGEDVGAWTGSEGAGGTAAGSRGFGARDIIDPPKSMPPRHMRNVMITSHTSRMSTIAGMSPRFANHSGFVPRIVTTSNVDTPVLDS